MEILAESRLFEQSSMRHWWPLVQGVEGIRMPRTEVVEPPDNHSELWLSLLDGHGAESFLDPGIQAVRARFPAPYFLRTDHVSGKHRWADTCHVPDDTDNTFLNHVCRLTEDAELSDMLGRLLPSALIFRELLPLKFSFRAFNQFPVAREFRVFAQDGAVFCMHPYWPEAAVAEGNPDVEDWQVRLTRMNSLETTEAAFLTEQAERLSALLGREPWSLDFAQSDDGAWWFIDAARAELSFHWPGCQVTACLCATPTPPAGPGVPVLPTP